MFRTPRLLKRSLNDLNRARLSVMERGAEVYTRSCEELSRAAGLNLYLFNKMIEGGVMPAMSTMLEINSTVADSVLRTIGGDRQLSTHLDEMSARTLSGMKFQQLVGSFGKQLFGSATFEGERVLAQDDLFRLCYLPPLAPAHESEAALFHVGGFLPFGDRIFRFLPGANLFQPFLERGIPVYLMELRGDATELANLGDCSFDRFIDTVDELTGVAFEHHGRRQMLLEGYCGLAMPGLSFVAAHPRRARERFRVAFTMVAPVDGRECALLLEPVEALPQGLMAAGYMMSELTGGVVSGASLRAGIDLPLGTLFHKTPLGLFAAGWNSMRYHRVERLEQLDFDQRRELAGAYWISPENCDRFPIAVDMARFSGALWTEGVGDDLRIPYSYRGRALDLRTIVEEAGLELVGFYGGRDKVVPEATARVLERNLGERYTHVVHPRAGHISYVLSPEIWRPGARNALDPNPIDLVLERYRRAGATHDTIR